MMKQLAGWWSHSFRLPLKDALFLGFCAVFAVLVRVVLRLHLHISGHAMIIKVFFLMLGRGVPLAGMVQVLPRCWRELRPCFLGLPRPAL